MSHFDFFTPLPASIPNAAVAGAPRMIGRTHRRHRA
jgi:hypothetical protein